MFSVKLKGVKCSSPLFWNSWRRLFPFVYQEAESGGFKKQTWPEVYPTDVEEIQTEIHISAWKNSLYSKCIIMTYCASEAKLPAKGQKDICPQISLEIKPH